MQELNLGANMDYYDWYKGRYVWKEEPYQMDTSAAEEARRRRSQPVHDRRVVRTREGGHDALTFWLPPLEVTTLRLRRRT